MRYGGINTVVRRVRKLEVRFGVRPVNAAVPSAAEVIIERLAAGEWQCALKLLELPEQAVLQAWHSIVYRRRGSPPIIDIDFADISRMHQRVTSSLADLPPEQRWRIAEQLLAADNNYSRARIVELERGAELSR